MTGFMRIWFVVAVISLSTPLFAQIDFSGEAHPVHRSLGHVGESRMFASVL